MAPPHANGGRGCPRRRTDPRSPSQSPPFARLSLSTPEWGRRLLPTPFVRAGRGRGGGDRCARPPVRLSGAKGGGRTLRAALHSPFAHRDGVAQTPRVKGGGNRAPPLSVRGEEGGRQGGAHRRGPRNKRGWGCKHAVCIPHLFCTPARLPCCAQSGEGADSGCRREEGERVLSLLPTSPDTRRRVVHVLFVFVFIYAILSLRKQKNVN